MLLVCFIFLLLIFVVSTSASSCMERLISDMTCNLLSGMWNSTHSLLDMFHSYTLFLLLCSEILACVICLHDIQSKVWLADHWCNGPVSWQAVNDVSPVWWGRTQGHCMPTYFGWHFFFICWRQLKCLYVHVSACQSTLLFRLQAWPPTSWPSHVL